MNGLFHWKNGGNIMRKVSEILKEIEETREHSRIINNISNKMSDDNDIRRYMMDTFKVDVKIMSNIASKLSIRASKLEDTLNDCELDIE